MSKLILLISLIGIFSGGCNSLAHLNELLTLKSVSDEQKLMDKDVKAHNKAFEKLLSAYQKDNFVRVYPTKEAVLKSFGAPVFIRSEIINGQPVEFLLYRKATEYFDSDKIYLYFDSTGMLQGHKRIGLKSEK